MPAEEVVVQRVADWSAGPWGILGPWEGPKAGHLFNSYNLVPYTNGMLGPRHVGETVHNFSTTFRPDAYRGLAVLVESFAHTKPTSEIVYVMHASTGYLWYKMTDDTSGSTVASVTGWSVQNLVDGDNFCGRNDYIQYGNDDILLHSGVRHADIDGVPVVAFQSYPASFAPIGCISFRDRYWAYGGTVNSNRIHWSTPGLLSGFAAIDYFDIGAAAERGIKGVWPLFDTLIIAMEDYTWWSYRFDSDPALGELKYLGMHMVPEYFVSVLNDGKSLSFTGRNEGIVQINPDGIDVSTYSHMQTPSWSFARRAVYCRQSNIGFLIGSNGAQFAKYGKNWFELSGVGSTCRDAFEFSQTDVGFLTSDSAVDTVATTFNIIRIRSEMSLDYLNQTSTGNLYLAGWRPPENQLAAVEKIVVDFYGLVDTSDFDVYINYVHNGVQQSEITVGSLRSADVVTGMNQFVIHPPRHPMGTSFEISIRNIAACAINEVAVHYSVQSQETATNTLVA